MKDITITITAKRVITELKIYGSCYLLAMLLNVVAIISYNTEWKELYTQIFWLAIIAAVMYAVTVGVRIAFHLFKRFTAKK